MPTTGFTKNFVVKNGLTTGNITLDASTSNITANVVVANLSVPATANLGSNANVTITGGSSGQFLQTNGAGGLSWASLAAASIANGTSNITAGTVNGNITVGIAGTASVAVFSQNGVNIANNANIGNLNVSSKVNFTSTSNVTLGSVSNLHVSGGASGQYLQTNGSSGLTWAALTAAGSTTEIQYNGSGEFASNPSFTYDPSYNLGAGLLSVGYGGDGTIETDNIIATAAITSYGTGSITGNLTVGNVGGANAVAANYFIGDGGYLTNVSVTAGSSIVNGNSNVQVTANSNVTVSVNGTSNTVVFTKTGANVAGYANVTGNISTSNYFVGNGYYLTGLARATTADAVANGTSNVNIPVSSGNATISVGGTSNVIVVTSTGENVAGYLTATGNITGGNANLGNLTTANYFSGNGSLLSAITGSNVTGQVGNANVSYYNNVAVATSGTFYPEFINASTAGNYAPYTNSAFTYNTTSGAFNATLLGGTLTTAAQPNITSVGTLTNTTMGSSNSLTGGNLVSATYLAGTLTSASNAQPNITSVGTLTGLTINGNLTINGTFEYANVSSFRVQDPIIEQGGNTSGGALTTNDGYDRGQLLHYYVTATSTAVDAFMGWKNSAGEFIFASNATETLGQIAVTDYGNIHAGYYIGNGSTLSGLNASNITSGTISSGILGNSTVYVGTTSIALNRSSGSQSLTGITSIDGYASTVSASSQPNIHSVGTLAGLTANSTIDFISASNVSLGSNANVHISGGSSGQYLQTDGSGGLSWQTISSTALSNGTSNVSIPAVNGNVILASGGNTTITVTTTGANITGYANVSGNITAGNVSATNLAGTLTTAAQTGITSVGTLSSLSVSGLITATGTGVKVANIQDSSGTVTITTKYSGYSGDVGIYANLTVGTSGTGNLTVNGNSALGSNANVKITGGSSGQFLSTDGAGNLSWNTFTSSPGGANTQIQFNDAGVTNATSGLTFVKTSNTLNATGHITRSGKEVITFVSSTSVPSSPIAGDEWYDQSNDKIYKYIYDGTTSTWIDVTSSYISAQATASASTLVQRDANANIAANYFIGNGYALTNINTNIIQNGTANASAFNNGNIAVSPAGNANVVVFTGTGANVNGYLTVTGNTSANNITTTGITDLNAIGNVKISGGSSGQIIQTDGAGNLSWTTISTSSISNGSSNVSIPASGGNATISVGGTANVLIVTTTGVNVSGTLNTGAGNANLGNLGTAQVLASANVTAPQLISNVATGTAPFVVTSTTVVPNLYSSRANVSDYEVVTAQTTGTFYPVFVNSNTTSNYALGSNTNINVSVATGAFNASLLGGTLTTAAQPNITSLGTLSSVTHAANANITLSGSLSQITGANLVSASYFTVGANGNIALSGSLSQITGANLVSGTYLGGTLTTAAQPNITSVGTLSSLTVTGTTTSGNIATAGNVTASYLVSNVATGTAPFTVTSTTRVGNLNVSYANVSDYTVVTAQTTGTFYPVFVNGSTTANYAYGSNANINVSVSTGAFNATLLGGTLTTAAQPNITSLGTLSSVTHAVNANITMSGASSQITGANLVSANNFTVNINGVITMSGGTSQITGANLISASYLGGILTASNQPNISNVGTLLNLASNGNVNFTNASNISLGSNANVHITGGLLNQVLTTDGSGGLSWSTVSAVPGGSNTYVQFNDNTSFGGSPGLMYDKSTTTLTANNLAVNYLATFADVGNVKIYGGSSGQVLKTDGTGNLSWTAAGGGSGTGIANGTSNIAIATSSGPVTVSVGGTPNITVFTSTGVQLGSNANVQITGGIAGQALITDGAGNLSWGQQGAPATFDYDDVSVAADGFTGTFPLNYNQSLDTTITDPYSIMVTVNGAIQAAWVYNTETVYQNRVLGTKKGYTIINPGYITFADPPPAGSDILVRTYTGSQNTVTKKYPFTAADIMFGY